MTVVQLVRLDQVLGLAAGAVDALIEPARRASEIGDDKAAVAALGRGLDAGDDPPLNRPGLGAQWLGQRPPAPREFPG
jgi:hypothetical protein